MISSLSAKECIAIALMFMVVVQSVVAQIRDDFHHEEYNCPNEYAVYYKDCQGSLDACSLCLGNAQRSCEASAKQNSASKYICEDCTTLAGTSCKSAQSMCFSDQECTGTNHKCVNFKCFYDKVIT